MERYSIWSGKFQRYGGEIPVINALNLATKFSKYRCRTAVVLNLVITSIYIVPVPELEPQMPSYYQVDLASTSTYFLVRSGTVLEYRY